MIKFITAKPANLSPNTETHPLTQEILRATKAPFPLVHVYGRTAGWKSQRRHGPVTYR